MTMARGAKNKIRGRPTSSNDDRDVSEDEVDKFHRTRLEALDATELQSGSEEESGEDEDLSEEDNEIFGEARPNSDSDSEDEDENGALEDEKIERIGKQWGKSRKDFYKQGDSEDEGDESGDEEDINEAEEAEAMRLQRKQASKLSSADFALGGSDEDESGDEQTSNKKQKKNKKKTKKQSDKNITLSRSAQNAGSDAVAKVAADAPELMALLAEFQDKTGELEKFAEPMLARIENGDVATKEGVSYLESKIQLMLSYCINITFYLLMKAEGKSVRDHPVIDQLLRCRTIMEKIRPLDAQLKHQVDMLIRQSDGTQTGSGSKGSKSVGKNDPLAFKPNLDDLDDDSSDEEDSDGNSSSGDSHDGKVVKGSGEAVGRYVVPKMAAAPFEEQERLLIKRAKEEEKRKRLLKKSKLYADMREEFSSRPTEQSAIGAERDDEDLRKEDDERRKYEEENYTRLVETKKDKQRRRKRERMVTEGMMSSMGDLEDLRDLEALVKPRRGDISDDDIAVPNTGKRSLSQFMSEMENKAKTKKKQRSGDEDLPIRDPEELARNRRPRGYGDEEPDDGLENHFGGGMPSSRGGDSDNDMDLAADNELYQQARDSAKRKKEARASKYAAPERVAPLPQQFLGDDEKRNASYKILKNKGLHAHKKKEERNPRVKLRKKFEKKMKRRKGQVQEMRTGESAMYGGEASGVRSSIVRSRKPGKV